jgi:hypothetical protein
VFISPFSIPSRSWTTLAAGARQFVVQLALLMMSVLGGVVAILVDPEDDRDVLVLGRRADDDLLRPASMWAFAFVASVKMPVLSRTMSTPRSPHGQRAGSFSARILISRPSMMIDWSPARTSPS